MKRLFHNSVNFVTTCNYNLGQNNLGQILSFVVAGHILISGATGLSILVGVPLYVLSTIYAVPGKTK